MKTNLVTKKTLTVGVLVIAIIVATALVFANKNLNKKLATEKLKSEMLLAEKLSKDKLVDKYQGDIKKMGEDNKKLTKLNVDTKLEVQAKNKEIEKLLAENTSIKTLKKNQMELEEQLRALTQENSALNRSIAQVKLENKNLNDKLASSTKTNSGLTSDNTILKAIISDNYRTEALRGKNEKLTIKAHRTNKLMVSFDLPGNIANDIYFKVVTPQGNELSSEEDLAATIQIFENGDGLLASSSSTNVGSVGTKRVEMEYKPKQKLSKGIYQFNIYNGDRFLGSTQMRLK